MIGRFNILFFSLVATSDIAQTFFYDIGKGRWENGPLLPHAAVPDRDAAGDPGPAPMLASPIVVWQNHAVAISGEVRASVRSPQVLAWPIPD
jgi:hypothetical protein